MDCSDPLKLGCDEFTTIVRRWEGGRKWHTGETDFTVVYMHMPHGTQGPQDIHILIVYPADVADCITFYFQIKT